MHEYPITCEIIRIAEKYAKQNAGARVQKMALVIGEDSGFIGDSIQMYFDIISKGTLCEGAVIQIQYIAPKLRCTQCNRLFVRSLLSFSCDVCGGTGAPTDIGKEFYIEYIEIED